MDSALSVAARRKLERRSVVFVGGRIENGRRYCTPCSVVNVSAQSSLKRGLVVESFTGYVKLEDIHVNTNWLHWPTRGDTKSWVFAEVVSKGQSKRDFVESTTGQRRRDIIELRVEYRWVN